jgi:hypothetical protein
MVESPSLIKSLYRTKLSQSNNVLETEAVGICFKLLNNAVASLNFLDRTGFLKKLFLYFFVNVPSKLVYL